MSGQLHVNGREQDVAPHDGEVLLETLRGLGCGSVRGTCGIGICGTCTVQVDGDAVSSCLMLTEQAFGRQVRTSEGLVDGGVLDDVQDAFVRTQAYQCSYCIPGMVMTVRALLDRGEPVTVEQVREELAGNLCRCGSYPQVLEAVREIVEREGEK